MQDALRKIISGIPCGCVFDSHYVISTLIQKHSDAYLNFADTLVSNESKTLNMHGKIGQEIAKFEEELTKRLPDDSWSLNIHQNSSKCTAWKKIK